MYILTGYNCVVMSGILRDGACKNGFTQLRQRIGAAIAGNERDMRRAGIDLVTRLWFSISCEDQPLWKRI